MTGSQEKSAFSLLCCQYVNTAHYIICLTVIFLPACSVLWLDVLTITGGRRLSAFGCQNGCVGLALVSQTGPGKGVASHKTQHVNREPLRCVANF